LVATALYFPELGHSFLWDDAVQISDNPAVRDGVPLKQYFVDRGTTSTRKDYNTRIYRPLRNLGLRGLWRVSNVAPTHRPWFFHGTNLVLYLVGGWLVLVLGTLVIGDARAAAIGAALWLLMPVHAEDVLYASAFGDLLSMVLQLGGLCCAIRAVDGDRPTRDLAAALALFALAVFTKEMAITSALLVPAYVLSERRARLREPRILLLMAGHALVAIAYLSLRTAILGRIGQGEMGLAALGRALVHLPWLLLLNLRVALQPLGHAPDYGGDLRGVLGSVLGALGAAALYGVCLPRSRRGLRLGALWFLLALLPVLQLVPMWTLLADRFLLVPSIGIALAIGALLAELGKRPAALSVVALTALVWAGGLALERGRFADDTRFWAWAVETVPDSSLSNHNLGLLFLDRGEPARSLPYLERAYALGRRHPRLFLHLASALEGLGRAEEAERAARSAVERDPDSGPGWAQLASLQRRRGDLDGAESSLTVAARVGCPEVTLVRQRGALRAQQQRLPEALADYRRLTDLEPSDPRAWRTRGELALHLGSIEEARQAAARCAAAPGCDALRQTLAR
jgi:tetratricopeptide (TPR) repeat protein